MRDTSSEQLGLVPRAVKELFARTERLRAASEDEYSVKMSFLQIYQERIYDLLNPATPSLAAEEGSPGLRLRWDAAKDRFFVENLFEYECSSADEAFHHYAEGIQRKHMASTAMNVASSRSHTVLVLNLVHRSVIGSEAFLDRGSAVREVVSNLCMVDLAGSERAAATNEGKAERFKEAVNINQSLFALRRVITALSRRDAGFENSDVHIPYRDSKLTSLLQHAIGGNGYMVMMACLTPSDRYHEENLSTLQYASQAALIKNTPLVQLDPKLRTTESSNKICARSCSVHRRCCAEDAWHSFRGPSF